MKFTSAQNKAIHTHGSSLLVSAAAGSGKTAVLVQRVIQKILAGGDISRLWIMTFTSAAAAEMRQKIETAILENLEKDPQNKHLQQQVLLLPSANISTIHSACKKIVEDNFQILELDPSVTIGEESVLDIMFQRTLEDLVEELYERAKTQADVKELIAFFSGGRNDEKLLGVLKAAYRYYVEEPFPKTVYQTGEDLFSSFADDALHDIILKKLIEAQSQYVLILADTVNEIAETTLFRSIISELEAVRLALSKLRQRSFDEVRECIQGIRFANWVTKAKVFEEYGDILERAKGRRTYAKNLITSLRQDVFDKSAAGHLAELEISNRNLTTLFSVVKELDNRFTLAKRERGFISFSDLERLALSLLVESYDAQTDTLTPTPLAKEMREGIDEIIVDEYQDTNRKQDLIFRALSKEGNNVFMVGDVKQSIYRFRAACPELFLEKKANCTPVGGSDEIDSPSYLYLNQNFRSHPAILSFANQIFGTTMSTGLGQIEYDASEQLYPGGLYPDDSVGHVELDVILTDNDPDDELPLLAIEKQATLVARKISALHGTPFFDAKKGAKRPLEYGDMAILCRVTHGVTGHFETALHRLGIHTINSNQDLQFLDVWEIKMLHAYLQVISNPYRDIPLITLMYSDFYGFSASQLASIRAKNKRVSFYDAVRLHAQEDPKCAAFLEDVEYMRRKAVGSRTDEILQLIFARTNILERVAGYPDGKLRVANMQLMLHYATQYEQNSYKGLFAFLNYLEKMSQLGKILPTAKQGQAPIDCVQILSTHKSKGLEYPVCFVINLEKSYTNQDTDTFISHRTLGPAVKMREDSSFTEYYPLSYKLNKEMTRRESLSEEMRILYVALTRPKTHLYLVCADKKKSLAKLLLTVDDYRGSAPSEFLCEHPSALKWILYALRGTQGLAPLYQALEVSFTPQEEKTEFVTEVYEQISRDGYALKFKSQEQEDILPDFDLTCAKYLFEAQTNLPIKLSVSEVKGMRENDPEAMPLIPEYFGKKRPAFLNNQVDGNVIGNAVHKFMQFADFKTLSNIDGFEKEAKRLLEKAYLTSREIDMVSKSQVQQFVAQPLFQDMISADKLEKEKRFFFSLPANRLYPNVDLQEPILLQGVLDCYYEKNGQLIIVDYKTDRLSSAEGFIDRYALQLKLYRYALAQITGKKADKLYIYSFHLNEVIEIS